MCLQVIHSVGKWTAYITDVGMSGDYNSVIGMEKAAISSFNSKQKQPRLTVADGLLHYVAL